MHLFVQQTAFVSLFYIFINMKPWNASNSSVVVVGLLLIMQMNKLFHWKATPTRAFNEFLYEFLRIFLISENSFKFANFFCWGNEFSIYGWQMFYGYLTAMSG